MKFHEIPWNFPWQTYHHYYNYKVRFNNPNIPTITVTIDCDIKPHAITTQCVLFLEFYTLKFQSAGFLAFEISLKFHEIAETQKALKFQVTRVQYLKPKDSNIVRRSIRRSFKVRKLNFGCKDHLKILERGLKGKLFLRTRLKKMVPSRTSRSQLTLG